MNAGSPDGERFVDEAEKPIPPKHTWDELTNVQLIDVKAQLQEKLWAFGNNPTISKVLQQGIAQLEAMISSRTVS